MSIEEIKYQIENMKCTVHDKHPVVEITLSRELKIEACCDEFLQEVLKSYDDKLFDSGISSGTI